MVRPKTKMTVTKRPETEKGTFVSNGTNELGQPVDIHGEYEKLLDRNLIVLSEVNGHINSKTVNSMEVYAYFESDGKISEISTKIDGEEFDGEEVCNEIKDTVTQLYKMNIFENKMKSEVY